MTDQKNFLNLVHNIDNTRVYKIDDEFFCFTATLTEIIPFSSKKVSTMANHLLYKVSDENCQVELFFGYAEGSLSKNRKKKLNHLLKNGKTDVDFKNISKWVSLLI